jgi:hypothetical protein
MTKTFDILAAVTIALAVVFAGFQLFRDAPSASAAVSDGPFYEMTNSTSTQVLTASKLISASSSASYRELNNLSGVPIHCSYNDATASNTTGFFLTASSTKIWVGENLYAGAIRCIASAAGNVTYNEAFPL